MSDSRVQFFCSSWAGWLIQLWSGIWGGRVVRRRSGWAARAASGWPDGRRRSPRWCRSGPGEVCQPMPECRWTWLYSVKNPSRTVWPRPGSNDPGSRADFRVLNCASENGLSLDTRGREVAAVTPGWSGARRPAGSSRCRSACTVWGICPLRAMASSMKSGHHGVLGCGDDPARGVRGRCRQDVQVVPHAHEGPADLGDVPGPYLGGISATSSGLTFAGWVA